MKKLIIMVAVVATAVVANASAVKWTASNVMDHNGKALNENAYATAYSAIVNFYTDAGGATPFAACASSTDVDYKMKQFTATTDDKFEVGTTYYAQLIISGSEAGTDYSVKSGIASFTVGAAQPSLNFSTGTDFDVADPKIDYSKGWSGGSSSTPEPTSGLLILLGMAGLALKRKVA